ncbi:Smr/MutS family protein [Aquamicrobium ahrensii]|uniref:DNA-nicking Smr family endonuclease n=1 Tax=Aquamicrobium ahrensii TaxID=469551 RepID=A0ABV2KND1_9HYPH
MTRRPQRILSDEDRVLWNLVARTAVPLKGRAAPKMDLEGPVEIAPAPSVAAPALAAAQQPDKKPSPPRHLDRPTLDKLAKGRLPIEARVDLHGMTQDEAYSLLFSFLHRAHASGLRYVLVITGKGSSSGGDGVLRRSVPGWLATPAFRMFVSSHEHAARHHGGSGALYVRLRKVR